MCLKQFCDTKHRYIHSGYFRGVTNVVVLLYITRHTHTHTIICLHSILFFVFTRCLPLAGHKLLFVSLASHLLHSAVHTHLQLCLTRGVLRMYMWWSDAVWVV
jgi:hypothetical protein